MELLLQRGPGNEEDDNTQSALHLGASVHNRNREGSTAFHFAANKSTGAMNCYCKKELR